MSVRPMKSLLNRNCLIAAGAALLLLAHATAALAQPYPNRPIRQIVPYASGSAADALARVAGDKLAQVLGQPVIIDSRPGANSIVGAEAAARAPADGYTFVQLNDAASTLNIALYPKLPYHTLKDFAPLTRAGSIAMVLVVNPTVPVTNVEEFLAWARASRDINFGSGGVGSAQHVLMEMLIHATGLRLTHVPYRGVTPAMNDVVAGHIPTMIVGLAGSLGAIRSGLLRAIAMTGPKRAAELPDVPTLADKGIAGFPAEPWTAFYAPAGTPAPILATLAGGLVETLNDAGVREKLKPVMEVETSTPEALRGMVERDIERYGKLVRDVGMKAE
jgi:tripartite-type tricarboxylate transporter receptor subunit TctC